MPRNEILQFKSEPMGEGCKPKADVMADRSTQQQYRECFNNEWWLPQVKNDAGVAIVQAYNATPRSHYEVKPDSERFSLISYANNREAHKTAVDKIHPQIRGAKVGEISFHCLSKWSSSELFVPANGI